MPTATKSPTADQLRAQLVAFENEIAGAERAVGVAELDGKSTTKALERLDRARNDASRARSALAELERREELRREGAAKAAAAREREAGYRWMVEYLSAAAVAIEAHQRAAATIERLAELQRPGRLDRIQRGLGVPWRPGVRVEKYEGRKLLMGAESDFDEELLRATQARFSSPRDDTYRPLGTRGPAATAEGCERLAARAEALADEEAKAADELERQLASSGEAEAA